MDLSLIGFGVGVLGITWVFLALFAALVDAGVGYIDEWLLKYVDTKKITFDAPGQLILISGFFGIIIALFVACISLFFNETYPLFISMNAFLLAVLVGIIEVLWLIPYFYAMERGGALNVTPVFQTIPIFALFFGFMFFSEFPSTTQITATVIIISGALLLNYSPTKKRFNLSAITLALLTSAIVSMGFFLFKDSALDSNFVAAMFGQGIGMFIFSLAIYAIHTPYRRQFNQLWQTDSQKIWLVQFCNEVLATIGLASARLAIVIGPAVMIVTAFDAFQPIFTLMIGWVLALFGSTVHQNEFGKKSAFIKVTAIILITSGALLISY